MQSHQFIKHRNFFFIKEEFGENVVINCNAGMRLPNTSSVSFRKTAITGGEILSRCPELMASTGAACHGTGKPSGYLHTAVYYVVTFLKLTYCIFLL